VEKSSNVKHYTVNMRYLHEEIFSLLDSVNPEKREKFFAYIINYLCAYQTVGELTALRESLLRHVDFYKDGSIGSQLKNGAGD